MSKRPAVDRVAHGPTASGGEAFGPFAPTLLRQAELVAGARSKGLDLTASIPLPLGMKLSVNPHNGQTQLILEAEAFCARFRRVYGYVGEISTKASQGTTTTVPYRPLVAYLWPPGVGNTHTYPPLLFSFGKGGSRHFHGCPASDCGPAAVSIWVILGGNCYQPRFLPCASFYVPGGASLWDQLSPRGGAGGGIH